VIALLSVGVGGYALYLVATGFAAMPLHQSDAGSMGLQVHVAASGVAMLVGAFQFFKPLRARAPTLHRWIGRVYVVACVIGGRGGRDYRAVVHCRADRRVGASSLAAAVGAVHAARPVRRPCSGTSWRTSAG
jgi:hypothetical protein